jgi:hypothetical protein
MFDSENFSGISYSCSNQTNMLVVLGSIFFCSNFVSCDLFSILNSVSIASRAIGGNGLAAIAGADLKVRNSF